MSGPVCPHPSSLLGRPRRVSYILLPLPSPPPDLPPGQYKVSFLPQFNLIAPLIGPPHHHQTSGKPSNRIWRVKTSPPPILPRSIESTSSTSLVVPPLTLDCKLSALHFPSLVSPTPQPAPSLVSGGAPHPHQLLPAGPSNPTPKTSTMGPVHCLPLFCPPTVCPTPPIPEPSPLPPLAQFLSLSPSILPPLQHPHPVQDSISPTTLKIVEGNRQLPNADAAPIPSAGQPSPVFSNSPSPNLPAFPQTTLKSPHIPLPSLPAGLTQALIQYLQARGFDPKSVKAKGLLQKWLREPSNIPADFGAHFPQFLNYLLASMDQSKVLDLLREWQD